jgi:acid phosphatase family membrane protein YuiD
MLSSFIQTRKVNLRYLVSTGGMPSAHSATAVGLSTVTGLDQGFHSLIFVVTFGIAFLVMFDAATVRRAAGTQARLLNQIIDELFKHHKLSEKKLAELLGHTRLEVLMGMIVGILVGTNVYALWLLHGPAF